MTPLFKKPIESKLEILKSILESHPFGYTLMELYRKFNKEHGIGSRNTLKKYLEILVEKGDLEIKVIGTYRIFRARNRFRWKNLFEQYPPLERLSMDFLAVLTKVLDAELPEKGKEIGREMGNKFPILESKVIKQYMRVKNFLKHIPFKEFFEKMNAKIMPDSPSNFTVQIDENQARLVFTNSTLLRNQAYIFFHILCGILEFHLNEIFNQNVTVNVESLSQKACTIILQKASDPS